MTNIRYGYILSASKGQTAAVATKKKASWQQNLEASALLNLAAVSRCLVIKKDEGPSF